MNPATLEALKGSIEKWEKIVAGTGTDEGPRNCPLCAMFFYNPECAGCPVAARVNDWGCDSTPYADYFSAEENYDGSAMAAAAKAELEFLRSLLPNP